MLKVIVMLRLWLKIHCLSGSWLIINSRCQETHICSVAFSKAKKVCNAFSSRERHKKGGSSCVMCQCWISQDQPLNIWRSCFNLEKNVFFFLLLYLLLTSSTTHSSELVWMRSFTICMHETQYCMQHKSANSFRSHSSILYAHIDLKL